MPVTCADGRKDGQRPPILSEGRYTPVNYFETTSRSTLVPHDIKGPQRQLMAPVSFRTPKGESYKVPKQIKGRLAPDEPMISESRASFAYPMREQVSPSKPKRFGRVIPGRSLEEPRPDPPSMYDKSLFMNDFYEKPTPKFVRHCQDTEEKPYRGKGEVMPRTFASTTTNKVFYDAQTLAAKRPTLNIRKQAPVLDSRPYERERTPVTDFRPYRGVSMFRYQYQPYDYKAPARARNHRERGSCPVGIGLDGTTYSAHFSAKEIDCNRPYYTTSIHRLE
mmetsp:Transcript_39740/g.86525  ORF Transcript_39740/g.86525 Transcript_39740/m.86525 type:complete len:278 (+) Transcript_39740:265-1098(+)|eukprot:CAMPEP_0118940500 /NCGR_PEP_ID=MMETSP1169-20130426/31575_1 /TAXON_ID=36882 /ORGANISM="Pyramimonas obovata, Strain CCMP722" /LENGTH=277 /DNA_ID=CAMNT_0006885001 /DNA_START=248 /DNA_END=1081 /DNA_ORIENTATION=-